MKKKEVVLFSIFYHDIIYSPGNGDNEYQSATLAAEALRKLGVAEEIIEDVRLYIDTTKDHKVPLSAERDLKFFIDFDLGILAANRQEYQDYCAYPLGILVHER